MPLSHRLQDETACAWQGRAGGGLVAAYRDAGLTVTTVAWAVGQPVEEVATRFRVLAEHAADPATIGCETRARPSPSPGPSPGPTPVRPAPSRGPEETPVRSAAPSPIAAAEKVLGVRLEVDGETLRLDGHVAALIDVVRAANGAGAAIAYPGLSPHPRSFHAGPSAARPPRRAKASPTGSA